MCMLLGLLLFCTHEFLNVATENSCKYLLLKDRQSSITV